MMMLKKDISSAQEIAPDRPAPSEEEIDEALKESFPASDPPFWTLGTNHREAAADEMAEGKRTID
jgi:hypothetical protein